MAAATALVLLSSWVCWVIFSGSTSMDLTWLELLKPYLPLFAELMLFSALGALLSLLMSPFINFGCMT